MPAHLVVYVACSLDGFIASPDGSVDWLPDSSGGDYGYNEFFECVTALVMGSKTYEEILTFGVWPYASKKTFVFTSRSNIRAINSNIEIVKMDNRNDVSFFIRRIKEKGQGVIWIVGGGQFTSSLEQADLVDEWVISFIPILLGAGIPLYPPDKALQRRLIKLHNYQVLMNGVVQLHYVRKDSSTLSIIPLTSSNAIGRMSNNSASNSSSSGNAANTVTFDVASPIFTYSIIVKCRIDFVLQFLSVFNNLTQWASHSLKFYSIMNILSSALSTSFLPANTASLVCRIQSNNNGVTVLVGKDNNVIYQKFSIILEDLSSQGGLQGPADTHSAQLFTAGRALSTESGSSGIDLPVGKPAILGPKGHNREKEERPELRKAASDSSVSTPSMDLDQSPASPGAPGGLTLVSLVVSRLDSVSDSDWSELCYLHSVDLKTLKDLIDTN